MTIRLLALAMVLALVAAGSSKADLFSYTAQSEPNASPDANRFVNGSPTGTVNLWMASFTGGPSNSGSFIGDSGANGGGSIAGAGNPAWALYANSGHTATATASVVGDLGRELSKKTESISIDFDNGWIDGGGSVGIRFLDGTNAIVSELRFTGGESNYKIFDSVSNFDTGIGFTANGLNVKLELEDKLGGYSLTVGAFTFAGRTLAAGANSVASVAVYNAFAGSFSERDIFFNNLQISSIPEPSSMVALSILSLGTSGIYLKRRRSAKRS